MQNLILFTLKGKTNYFYKKPLATPGLIFVMWNKRTRTNIYVFKLENYICCKATLYKLKIGHCSLPYMFIKGSLEGTY